MREQTAEQREGTKHAERGIRRKMTEQNREQTTDREAIHNTAMTARQTKT